MTHSDHLTFDSSFLIGKCDAPVETIAYDATEATEHPFNANGSCLEELLFRMGVQNTSCFIARSKKLLMLFMFAENDRRHRTGSLKRLENYGYFHYDFSFLRLPPPGGTWLQKSIWQGLITSFILSCHVTRVIGGVIHITIFVDVDYDHAIGGNSFEIYRALNEDLDKLFQLSGMRVGNVSVKKGSVIISFDVNNHRRDGATSSDATKIFIQATDSSDAIATSTNYGKTNHRTKPGRSLLQNHQPHSEGTYLTEPFILRRRNAQRASNWFGRVLLQQSSSGRKSEYYQSDPQDKGEDNSVYELHRGDEERLMRKRASTSSNTRIAVRFSVVGNYDSLVSGRREVFLKHIQEQVALEMRVPLSSVQDLSVETGMVISFVVTTTNDKNNIMDDRSVIDAVDDLRSRIREKRLRLTDLDGRSLDPVSDAFITSQDDESDFTPAILGLLIAVLIMVFTLIIFAAIITRNITRSDSKKTPSKRNKAYRPIAAIDTGRDSSQSIGKYSYDSGLWLGPGPEPMYTVPEAPFYRPPTADQVSSTPRPGTSVRTRLKRNWNIDDRTLTPMPDEVEMPWERRRRERHHQKQLDTISESNT